jgi:D-glucosaminate-6-phosphate ammonia-lyase
MPDRRTFLQRLASLPALSALLPNTGAAAPAGRDYFRELGVRTFINAAGTYTMFTASLMPPEVMEAMQYASHSYVPLNELHDKAAARIASLIGVEAVMITSGAAGALLSGTAACITGTDQKAIQQIPDLTGLKSEVIIQKEHRYGYDHAVRATGVRLVEVETAQQLEAAINPKTAMMLFFNDADPKGQIHAGEFVALARKHGVPTLNDAAADVPPVEHFSKYTKMGFDLVAFSGGKGIRGPQSAGLLLGNKDLIAAARLNSSPNSDSIGRSNKVNKEEMLGMMVAVESYLAKDHAAEWKEWERRVKTIADSVRDLPSIQTETWIPEIANHVPHLKIRWDPAKIRIAPPEVIQALREGQPSIEGCPATTPQELVIGVWMMQRGDTEVVARRVREILKAHA